DGRVLEPLIPEIRGVPERGLILALRLACKGSRTSITARLSVDEPVITRSAVVQGKVDLYMGMLGNASN
ncbi:hypothetical protein Godav_004370, partial [Gossypium davidsonii]|nr:hypothetical protein [Gossypium davidsonii]